MNWSYDSTSVGVYGVFTDLRSKVIKGSLPVRIQKSLRIHTCQVQYSTQMSFGQMKDHSPVLLQLTQTWGQRSFRVISGACKKGQMDKISYISASGGTIKPIIANLIEHSMDSTSMVVMTPKVKVYGSKVEFSTYSYGAQI